MQLFCARMLEKQSSKLRLFQGFSLPLGIPIPRHFSLECIATVPPCLLMQKAVFFSWRQESVLSFTVLCEVLVWYQSPAAPVLKRLHFFMQSNPQLPFSVVLITFHHHRIVAGMKNNQRFSHKGEVNRCRRPGDIFNLISHPRITPSDLPPPWMSIPSELSSPSDLPPDPLGSAPPGTHIGAKKHCEPMITWPSHESGMLAGALCFAAKEKSGKVVLELQLNKIFCFIPPPPHTWHSQPGR